MTVCHTRKRAAEIARQVDSADEQHNVARCQIERIRTDELIGLRLT